MAIMLHYPSPLLSRLVSLELLHKVYGSQSKSHTGGHEFLSLVLGLSQKPQGTRGHKECTKATSVPPLDPVNMPALRNRPWALPLLRARSSAAGGGQSSGTAELRGDEGRGGETRGAYLASQRGAGGGCGTNTPQSDGRGCCFFLERQIWKGVCFLGVLDGLDSAWSP